MTFIFSSTFRFPMSEREKQVIYGGLEKLESTAGDSITSAPES